MTPEVQATKADADKRDHSRLKIFCTGQETLDKVFSWPPALMHLHYSFENYYRVSHAPMKPTCSYEKAEASRLGCKESSHSDCDNPRCHLLPSLPTQPVLWPLPFWVLLRLLPCASPYPTTSLPHMHLFLICLFSYTPLLMEIIVSLISLARL